MIIIIISIILITFPLYSKEKSDVASTADL